MRFSYNHPNYAYLKSVRFLLIPSSLPKANVNWRLQLSVYKTTGSSAIFTDL